ncbi:copper chaperone PCu(A)C [Bradyrhizobium liaoningense]|uniref:copper chaperone PCu(A)C n=1 Tax=Bradyrhizobium liaoningense TaxID=43992 RepID=UPI001BA5E8F2|nr:copper chaperone PCu(A)C [Bradyrhizobium liaoningense]MBR0719795.1 copper chaperone PCu(A)C [Bradyrhizobium liaoningense]
MIISRRALACAAALSCLVSQPAHAGDASLGDLVITRAWSRATPGGAKVAGGYLTIENKGKTPERLKAAATALAAKTEIHEMAVTDGVMTMRPIEGGIVIAPGGSVQLMPGSGHLMLVGLNAALRQGDQVPVTLSFERAGDVKVTLDVQAVGAQAPEFSPRAEAAKPETIAAAAEDDESFFTHLHAERAMANVTVTPGRAGPVEIAIQLEDANELPLSANSVAVTLGNPEHGVAPITARAERIGHDQWRVKMAAPLSGRWSLGLAIGLGTSDLGASDTVNVVSPILLR